MLDPRYPATNKASVVLGIKELSNLLRNWCHFIPVSALCRVASLSHSVPVLHTKAGRAILSQQQRQGLETLYHVDHDKKDMWLIRNTVIALKGFVFHNVELRCSLIQ